MSSSPEDRSREAAVQLQRLVSIMRTLRSPEGCPWDREQTLASLAHFVLEEAYEVVDAIERDDLRGLAEEIGDHVFEAVFLAQIAAENGAFDLADSLKTVCDKLVRRHPHVFREDGRPHDADSRERAPSAEAALKRWNAQKVADGAEQSVLGSIPNLPALLRAFKLGKRAAEIGFDWPDLLTVMDKIDEEARELRETLELHPDNQLRAEEEMGDLLFAMANLSRKLGIEPEAALRRANDKFTRRFQALERRFADESRPLQSASLDEMEAVWREVKASETKK